MDRKVEVKEEELVELGYISMLTAGIATCFEISDSLKGIDGEMKGENDE